MTPNSVTRLPSSVLVGLLLSVTVLTAGCGSVETASPTASSATSPVGGSCPKGVCPDDAAHSAPAARTDSAAAADSVAAAPAINGYCPVSLVEARTLNKGGPATAVIAEGQVFWTSNAENRKKFETAPERYTPVLKGACAKCMADSGAAMAGNPEHSVVHNGRLYLFVAESHKQAFEANPERYVSER